MRFAPPCCADGIPRAARRRLITGQNDHPRRGDRDVITQTWRHSFYVSRDTASRPSADGRQWRSQDFVGGPNRWSTKRTKKRTAEVRGRKGRVRFWVGEPRWALGQWYFSYRNHFRYSFCIAYWIIFFYSLKNYFTWKYYNFLTPYRYQYQFQFQEHYRTSCAGGRHSMPPPKLAM